MNKAIPARVCQLVTRAKAKRLSSVMAIALGAALLSGCASGPNANPKDPLEPWNRGVYKFNTVVDNAVLKPVATVYKGVTPSPVRRGVSNFFGNLQDIWSTVNNALQLKAEGTAVSLMRVSVNTVFGFLGLLDIASEMRLDKKTEGFGDTLGYWGVGAGPFLMLPILGPSTLRDTAAMPVDWKGDAVLHISDSSTRSAAAATRVVSDRAEILGTSDLLGDVSLDEYSFLRDAYLQRRLNQVYDGNPPEEADPTEETTSAQDAAAGAAGTPAQTSAPKVGGDGAK